jgi:uncharacterized tellurite resistance protein B-like protein
MIRRLFTQVIEIITVTTTAEPSPEERESALRLATAVLMVDVARADRVFDESEFERTLKLIERHFGLTTEEAAQLVNEADEKADDLVSAYELTEVLHKHLNEDEKTRIIGLLWDIAYADGALDKYEDALILKISDLLYVSRARVMRLKHDAALRRDANELNDTLGAS